MPVSKATQGVPNLKFLVNQSDTVYVSEMGFQSYEINNHHKKILQSIMVSTPIHSEDQDQDQDQFSYLTILDM